MLNVIHRQSVLLCLVFVQGLLMALFVMGTSFYINHDAALYLQCGQLVLDGKIPYVDFYDNNPPLIMVLSCLPVLFSELTNISLMGSFAIFVICLTGLSTKLICTLVTDKNDGFIRLWFLLSGWFLFHLLTAICRDFGQREHLFATCSAPYVLLRITRFNNRLSSFSPFQGFFIGFYAAIGIFLKPHFLVIVLFFELFLFSGSFKNRMLLKPEIAGILVFGLIYIGIFLISPSIRTNYLELIAPLVARGNWVYYVSTDQLLANFHPLRNARNIYFLFCLFITLATGMIGRIIFRANQLLCQPGLALLVAAIVSLGSYFYQAKGWPYHLVPFCFYSGFAFVYNVSEFSRQNPKTNLKDLVKLGLLIILIACTTTLEYHYYLKRKSLESAILNVIENESSVNNRVIVFSTSMSAYPAMIQANKRPGSRFLWFFPFALLYANAHDPNLTEEEILSRGPLDAALETRFLRELSDDIVALKPGLIMINTNSGDQGLPYRLHFKNYLAHHKILDLIKSRYRLVREEMVQSGPTSRYEVWSLRPELK